MKIEDVQLIVRKMECGRCLGIWKADSVSSRPLVLDLLDWIIASRLFPEAGNDAGNVRQLFVGDSDELWVLFIEL